MFSRDRYIKALIMMAIVGLLTACGGSSSGSSGEQPKGSNLSDGSSSGDPSNEQQSSSGGNTVSVPASVQGQHSLKFFCLDCTEIDGLVHGKSYTIILSSDNSLTIGSTVMNNPKDEDLFGTGQTKINWRNGDFAYVLITADDGSLIEINVFDTRLSLQSGAFKGQLSNKDGSGGGTTSWGWGTAKSIQADNKIAATNPNIAVTDNGSALAVWMQSDGTAFNSIWTNRYDPATGWSTPVSIDNGSGNNTGTPRIAVAADGSMALAVWSQQDGAIYNIWANRYDPTTGWGTAELIETNDSGAATSPQIIVAGDRALAVWSQHDGTIYNIWANSYYSAIGWGTAKIIEANDNGNATSPQIAVSGNSVFAVWVQQNGFISSTIWGNRYDLDTLTWSGEQQIGSNTSGYAYSPQFEGNGVGSGMVIWTHRDNNNQGNVWTNLYDPVDGWGTAMLVETNDNGSTHSAEIAVAADGSAIAVWTHDDGTIGNIYANHYDPDTGWGTPELIENDNTFNNSLPQVVITKNGNAFAVWQQHVGIVNLLMNHYNPNTGWDTPALIDDNSSGFNDRAASLDIAADGSVMMVWMRSQGIGTPDNIWANLWTGFGQMEQ